MKPIIEIVLMDNKDSTKGATVFTSLFKQVLKDKNISGEEFEAKARQVLQVHGLRYSVLRSTTLSQIDDVIKELKSQEMGWTHFQFAMEILEVDNVTIAVE